MITQVSQGVSVSVFTSYEEELSNPLNRHFIFTYRIRIENQNNFTIQLLRRHWEIQDSLSFPREVEGEGVIGEQPLLEPGHWYEYESACNLTSNVGSTYLFQRVDNGNLFQANIPLFMLVTPDKLN